MKHIEVITLENSGVGVAVMIDYDNGLISLVEKEKGAIPARYKTKDWRFGGREVEHMNGWVSILNAMTHATLEAKKLLEVHQEEEMKQKAELLIALSELSEKENAKL